MLPDDIRSIGIPSMRYAAMRIRLNDWQRLGTRRMLGIYRYDGTNGYFPAACPYGFYCLQSDDR
jgi:hypothetical protein